MKEAIMYAEMGSGSGLTQREMRFFSGTRSMIPYFEDKMSAEYDKLQVDLDKTQERLDKNKYAREWSRQNDESRASRLRRQMDMLGRQTVWEYINAGYRKRFFLVEVDSGKKPKKIGVKELEKLAQQGF